MEYSDFNRSFLEYVRAAKKAGRSVDDAASALAYSGALLHQAEGGTSLLIERHNLAIKHHLTCVHPSWKVPQLGVGDCQVVLIARDEADGIAIEKSHSAIAIPLHFVKPLLIVEWLVD